MWHNGGETWVRREFMMKGPHGFILQKFGTRWLGEFGNGVLGTSRIDHITALFSF